MRRPTGGGVAALFDDGVDRVFSEGADEGLADFGAILEGKAQARIAAVEVAGIPSSTGPASPSSHRGPALTPLAAQYAECRRQDLDPAPAAIALRRPPERAGCTDDRSLTIQVLWVKGL